MEDQAHIAQEILEMVIVKASGIVPLRGILVKEDADVYTVLAMNYECV